MSPLDTLGYTVDAWIIITYLILALKGSARPFHWANAFGCFPVLLGEIVLGAYVPMVLTAFFGMIGWVGLWATRPDRDLDWD